jgi:hypothetical protein
MDLKRTGQPIALLPAVGVVLVTLLLLHTGTHAPVASHVGALSWSSPTNATNGVLDSQLNASVPTDLVSLTGAGSGYGLFAGLGGIEEVGGSGAVISTADLSSQGPNETRVAWVPDNASAGDHLSEIYSASLEVFRPSGVPVSGAAELTVTFSASGGPSTNLSQASAVSMTITLAKWPWIHPTDSLALELPIAPRNSSEEMLLNGSTDTMDCADARSQQVREFLQWSPTALVTDPSGDVIPQAPAAAVLGSPSNATVEVLVPGGSPAFVGLQYTVDIGVLPIVPPTSLPTAELVAALLGVGVLGGGLIIAVRWAWSRPSDLTNVSEDSR